MTRPALLRLLPEWIRERVYFMHYHTRHAAWRQLFVRAPLSLCPQIAMYDLVVDDVISGCIAFNGFYECALTKRIAGHGAKGGLLVDVGANMGYFSLLWAGLHPSNRVLAFEASPRNIDLFRHNVRKNELADRITIIPKAAGDRTAAVQFDAGPPDQTGWGGISVDPSAHSISVPMVRLDDVLLEKSIDVLKIDAEGADSLVLLGCERLLKDRKVKIIYFEENVARMRQLGLKQGEARQFLRGVGYDYRPLGENEEEWCAYPA